MPLRQTIGISLALLMASTGAMAKSPEKSAVHHASAHHKSAHATFAKRSGRSHGLHRTAHLRSFRFALHRSGRSRSRQLALQSGGASEADWTPIHNIGFQQIGRAAWYALVGSRTSNGERLDTHTATAAHRYLPLGSCARVTNLDTGRSVVVRINDRGPYNRRFIIDLSPRAAADLGMIRSGTAAVVVETVAGGAPDVGARSTVAVEHTPSGLITQ